MEDLAKKLEALQGEYRDLAHDLGSLKDMLRSHAQTDADQLRQLVLQLLPDPSQYVTKSDLDLKLERLAVEVIREVSGKLQAMVHDAITSAWAEDFEGRFETAFTTAYTKHRNKEREERKEDFRDMLAGAQRMVKYVLPFLQVVSVGIGIWIATHH